ncbi:MAG: hypothetical protein ACO1Q7_19090 [Gemmatimonas sp.]
MSNTTEQGTAHAPSEDKGITWLTPPVAWGIAGASLVLGYVDLWRGGTTISALLLTLGYVIFVPIAIVTLPKNKQQAK